MIHFFYLNTFLRMVVLNNTKSSAAAVRPRREGWPCTASSCSCSLCRPCSLLRILYYRYLLLNKHQGGSFFLFFSTTAHLRLILIAQTTGGYFRQRLPTFNRIQHPSNYYGENVSLKMKCFITG